MIKRHNNHNQDEINRNFDLSNAILPHLKKWGIAHHTFLQSAYALILPGVHQTEKDFLNRKFNNLQIILGK
jgi:hypothetical protein